MTHKEKQKEVRTALFLRLHTKTCEAIIKHGGPITQADIDEMKRKEKEKLEARQARRFTHACEKAGNILE